MDGHAGRLHGSPPHTWFSCALTLGTEGLGRWTLNNDVHRNLPEALRSLPEQTKSPINVEQERQNDHHGAVFMTDAKQIKAGSVVSGPTLPEPVEVLATVPMGASLKVSGSGSTLIACEQTSRKAFLMELDPLYCDVIVQRWEQFTGKQAQRQGAV